MNKPLYEIRDRLAGEWAYYETLHSLALGTSREKQTAAAVAAADKRLKAFDAAAELPVIG